MDIKNHKAPAKVCDDTDELRLPGILLDEVEIVVPPTLIPNLATMREETAKNAAKVLEWEDACHRLARQSCTSGMPEAYCRTLCADQFSSRGRPDVRRRYLADDARAYDDMMTALSAIAAGDVNHPSIQRKPAIGLQPALILLDEERQNRSRTRLHGDWRRPQHMARCSNTMGAAAMRIDGPHSRRQCPSSLQSHGQLLSGRSHVRRRFPGR